MGGCNVVAIQSMAECMSLMVCMVCWSLSYVVKYRTWQIWTVFYAQDCGVSNAEYLVHSVLICTIMPTHQKLLKNYKK